MTKEVSKVLMKLIKNTLVKEINQRLQWRNTVSREYQVSPSKIRLDIKKEYKLKVIAV
jgi:hypothetical protein